jgi:hypothetical protein
MNPLVAEIIAGIGKHEVEAFLGAAVVAEYFTRPTAKLIPPYDPLVRESGRGADLARCASYSTGRT